MGDWIRIAVWALVSGLRSRRNLALENVALRRQVMVVDSEESIAVGERLTEGQRDAYVGAASWITRSGESPRKGQEESKVSHVTTVAAWGMR